MSSEKNQALLAKEFVLRKIDVDRTLGGKELSARYGGEKLGLPWFCVLDARGEVLGNSLDAKGKNIGCPYKDDEIAAFTAMLAKVARRLTAEDIATLRDSLGEMRKSDERKAAEKKQKSP
jgi:hypothetical protein